MIAALRLVIAADPRAACGHLITALFGGAAPVAAAWLTKLILDRVAAGTTSGVLGLAIALVGIGIVAAVLPQVERYLRAEVHRATGLLARDRLFAALERLRGLARFENPAFHDRLQLAVNTGRTSPPAVLFGGVELIRGGLTIFGFAASLLLLSPLVTMIVLIGAVPVAIAEFTLARDRASMLWEIEPWQRRELFYANLLSGVRAAQEVRLFGLGRFFRNRMVAELRAVNSAERRMDRREVGVQGLLAVLSAGIAGYGLVWVVQAGVSVGDIAIFVAAVASVQAALASGVDHAAQIHQALLLFDHYLVVTRVRPDLVVPTTPRPIPKLGKGIELHDVWFRYSETHPWVLRGVNLAIPAGTATALVGHNGSGKSTIIKLLCRLYEPDRGTIVWDGVDLRDLHPDELRHRIGVVFQDYMDYDLAAAENIALGDLSSLDDRPRLADAARRAGAHDTIMALPNGYDTMLSRTFTSTAEHDVHTRLRAHRTGRTSVLISHRLNTIRDADQIAVLYNGQITETGNHDQLLASGGTYAKLYTLQSSGYREEAHQ